MLIICPTIGVVTLVLPFQKASVLKSIWLPCRCVQCQNEKIFWQ